MSNETLVSKSDSQNGTTKERRFPSFQQIFSLSGTNSPKVRSVDSDEVELKGISSAGESSVAAITSDKTKEKESKGEEKGEQPPTSRREHIKGVIFINIVTALYASDFAIVKDMGHRTAPSITLFLRFALAALIFLPSLRNADRKVLLAGFEIGFWIWAGYAAEATGLQYAKANRTAFMGALSAIIVPFLEYILLSRSMELKVWIAAVLAISGVGLLELAEISGPNAGDAWCLLMACCWGVSIMRTEKYAPQFSTAQLMAANMLTVSFLSLLWMLLFHPHTDFSHVPWIEVTYTGIVSTALTLWLETMALKKITAVETTVILGMEPVWASLFSWIFLGELLSLQAAFGACLIVSAVLCSQLDSVTLSEWVRKIRPVKPG
mmetsp:Transcript_32848/g.53297  ORF Transcript_32848/g.53297 Transcript_32848/m.53297 type:complete len:379 (-) Transcript_32848:283-1419(-)|eukprot:CAMPEP_0184646838 /NCGR_PEP_ID=MMETSP0308-20130426/3629_1 /TAXON_ID=38269 /ORGANISM="Gloeochaete witrockiana, Strain SAG 46.84" /LENGTH=378 /DNA_ID=CAMNT_0027077253 /DNA_START=163 /DNA_END=1299 /DNA_ORIENTATION=-